MDLVRAHPIWIFGTGFGAACAFVVTIFLPMTTAYLTSQIETMKPAQERLVAAEAKIAEMAKDLAKIRADRDDALQRNPFSGSSIYPIGLADVELGAPISRVLDNYKNVKSEGENEKKPTYLTATVDHPIFSGVVYYPSYDKKEKGSATVGAILFHIKSDAIAPESLKRRFTQMFGPPLAESKGRAYWQTPKKQVVELELTTVFLMNGSYVPEWAKKE
jgi:hypothetical protein